jgi:beta-lactamase regulating signal transducer with metallopeptidase domain
VTGLLIATMQTSAILLVAFVLLRLFRKRTAGLRHAVILIAMACASVVPALGFYLPSWPSTTLVLPTLAGEPSAMPVSPDASSRLLVTPLPEAAAQDSTSATSLAVTNRPTDLRHLRTTVRLALDVALVIYFTGLAISIAMLCVGLLELRRIAAGATRIRSMRWQRRCAGIAAAYGLRRRVDLAQTSRPILATWGFLRPQVLLPVSAEDWPDDRIRTVLLHELAHIRRNDWIVQILANTLRAIYWFNPLVWIACSRLQQECEQACDDAAVQQGEDGVEYAGHLLALARGLSASAPPQLRAAAPMARPTTLKRRVAVLLDPAVPHTPVNLQSAAGIAVVLVAVTALVAACDGVRSTSDEQAAAAPLQSPGGNDLPLHATVSDEPESTQEVDPSPVADDSAARMSTSPLPVTPPEVSEAHSSASRLPTVPRSPGIVVADILDLVQSALADESLAALDEIQRPITGLHYIQRSALAIVSGETGAPAFLAASYMDIINGLKNTATFASSVTSTPRGARLPKKEVDLLAAAMRKLAEELADATIPTPSVTSVNVSTAERRVAISALDVAQTTLRNVALVGPRSNSWLGNELETLERAAQSALSDDGTNQDRFIMKLHALSGALLSTSRNADNIARRPRLDADIRRNATELSASGRRLANQLAAAMPPPGPRDLPDAYTQ